jgi:hypothetical protein
MILYAGNYYTYIGFGGKVVQLIRAMYFNDCVRINLKHGLTEPLYFTQGVKQGCSLSPMLFALYISGLGDHLHASRLGIEMGTEIITALFFADDLVLISKTPKVGMDKLIKIVSEFCEDMRMTLSPTKTNIITNAPYEIAWKIADDTIEEILVAKYLGVKIQIRGRTIIGNYEEDMIRRAKSYAYSLMNLTRGGLDRAHIAHKVWESCAIPAILYCAEAVSLKRSTLDELERIQNHLGRFILQVPSATSRSLAWLDAGLMPMECRILIKQARYIWHIIKSKGNGTLLHILQELLNNPIDPWTKSWLGIQGKIGIISTFVNSSQLNKSLKYYAMQFVMDVKNIHPTVDIVPQPLFWFKLQGHVNDSLASQWLCRVRGGNAQLGNRYKNKYEKIYEFCPHCITLGHQHRLDETHVILCCPLGADLRRDLGVFAFAASRPGLCPKSTMMYYVGGYLAQKTILLERGRSMGVLIEDWMIKIHEG